MTSVRAMSARAVLGVLLAAPFAAADEPDSSAGAAPHVVVEKNGQSTRVVTQSNISIDVKLAAKPTKACQATITTRSEQRNTLAHVEGTIESADCAACSGDYTLVVRIRDASGETRTLEFSESWRRADEAPVKFTADYPIGDDVDLLGVRSKGLHCVCAGAAAADGAAERDE